MRFVSFNINGLRAHIHQLDTVIKQLQPDVIGLQETKIHDNEFPINLIVKYGYNIYYHGQKKDYGVALFLRQSPLSITKGLMNNNYLYQNRIISANIHTSIGTLTIINVYCPQGENYSSNKFLIKKQFYENFKNYIQQFYHKKSLLLIMGDMNISPTDLDVGIGEKNKKKWLLLGKCSFLPEERKWINQLIDFGLIDIYRKMHPNNNNQYSWFSYISNRFYKNQGLRIDLILITQPLANHYKHCDIGYNIRNMNHPSDHAPIWIDLNI